MRWGKSTTSVPRLLNGRDLDHLDAAWGLEYVENSRFDSLNANCRGYDTANMFRYLIWAHDWKPDLFTKGE